MNQSLHITKNHKLAIVAILLLVFVMSMSFSSDNLCNYTQAFKFPQNKIVFTSSTPIRVEIQTDGSIVEPLDIVAIQAGHGVQKWSVINTGLTPALLDFEIINLQNLENGCSFAERIVDSSCGPLEGDLGKYLQTGASLIVDGRVYPLSSFFLTNEGIETLHQDWDKLKNMLLDYDYSKPGYQDRESDQIFRQINPSQRVLFRLDWRIDQENITNEIQSDSVSFEVLFRLTGL